MLNSTEILKDLWRMVACLDKEEASMCKTFVERHENLQASVLDYSLSANLASLIIRVQDDINLQEAKKSGKSNALKTAQKLLESAKKNTIKEEFHFAETVNGKQAFCDGYIAVLLNSPLALPEMPEKNKIKCYGYSEMYKLVNSVISSGRQHTQKLELPSISELKADIKTLTAKLKANNTKVVDTHFFYDFCIETTPTSRTEVTQPVVAAKRLLQVMEILGEDTEAYYDGNGISSIYFVNKNGDEAILMSVRTDEGCMRKRGLEYR